MPGVAGEADLYVCRQGSQKYVAKVYRRTASITAEVIEQLRRIKSPYIAAIYEVGAYRGATVEILPYYSRGSLSGRTFHYEQLRSKIIPCSVSYTHLVSACSLHEMSCPMCTNFR